MTDALYCECPLPVFTSSAEIAPMGVTRFCAACQHPIKPVGMRIRELTMDPINPVISPSDPYAPPSPELARLRAENARLWQRIRDNDREILRVREMKTQLRALEQMIHRMLETV